ncbi:MAG: hypothetical protein PVG39_15330 [Desulfobacteraceae bacterium]|jgi:hypothetical protein
MVENEKAGSAGKDANQFDKAKEETKIAQKNVKEAMEKANQDIREGLKKVNRNLADMSRMISQKQADALELYKQEIKKAGIALENSVKTSSQNPGEKPNSKSKRLATEESRTDNTDDVSEVDMKISEVISGNIDYPAIYRHDMAVVTEAKKMNG